MAGYECAHMIRAKWDLLIWRLEDGGAGAGQWAPGGGAGKKRAGVPGHGS